jgi:hypothetical protein
MIEPDLYPNVRDLSDLNHTRTELLNNLRFILNAFLFENVSAHEFASRRSSSYFRHLSIQLGDPDGRMVIVKPATVGSTFDNAINVTRMATAALIAARIDLVRMSHEFIQEYCSESGQTNLHVQQPWYQFSRLLRNSMSHRRSGFLGQWPASLMKKGVKSVSWRHKTLDSSEVGKRIHLSGLDAFLLWEDQYKFCEATLR